MSADINLHIEIEKLTNEAISKVVRESIASFLNEKWHWHKSETVTAALKSHLENLLATDDEIKTLIRDLMIDYITHGVRKLRP